jgi:hypothetical protein
VQVASTDDVLATVVDDVLVTVVDVLRAAVELLALAVASVPKSAMKATTTWDAPLMRATRTSLLTCGVPREVPVPVGESAAWSVMSIV